MIIVKVVKLVGRAATAKAAAMAMGMSHCDMLGTKAAAAAAVS